MCFMYIIYGLYKHIISCAYIIIIYTHIHISLYMYLTYSDTIFYILRYVLSVFVYDCMLLFRIPNNVNKIDKHDGM